MLLLVMVSMSDTILLKPIVFDNFFLGPYTSARVPERDSRGPRLLDEMTYQELDHCKVAHTNPITVLNNLFSEHLTSLIQT